MYYYQYNLSFYFNNNNNEITMKNKFGLFLVFVFTFFGVVLISIMATSSLIYKFNDFHKEAEAEQTCATEYLKREESICGSSKDEAYFKKFAKCSHAESTIERSSIYIATVKTLNHISSEFHKTVGPFWNTIKWTFFWIAITFGLLIIVCLLLIIKSLSANMGQGGNNYYTVPFEMKQKRKLDYVSNDTYYD